MKLIYIILIICLATFNSCMNHPKDETIVIQDSTVTPEILDDNQNEYSLSYISKRSDNDIISKLYSEAIKKNIELKQLNERIFNISSIKNDSLESYINYSNTNKNYWLTTSRYINEIQDSVLRANLSEYYREMESKYNTSVSEYELNLKRINKKTISLNDQLIMMKLIVTEPMMNNYQKNEIPNIKALETIINEYDKLIQETKQITN